MLGKSLILAGTTVFIAGYMSLQSESAEIAKWRIAPDFLWFWLLTQWGLAGIQTWNRLPLPAIPPRISQGLCFGLRSVRLFGILYLGLEWFLDGSGSILILARMLFGIGLLTGFIHFWKSAEPHLRTFSDRFPQIHPDLDSGWICDCRSRACPGIDRLRISGHLLVYILGHYHNRLFLGRDIDDVASGMAAGS